LIVVCAQPSIAIVITTYNHAHFLDAALTSARDQSVAATEVIVVDDGSIDHPEHIVQRFPGVRCIRQMNAGLTAARNTGWRAASSEFVTFLDADDRLRPDALRVNLARLLAHPEAPFAYGGYVDVHASTGATVPVTFRPAMDGYASFLRENVIGMHATVLYRRRWLEQIGGFRNGLPACEDYDVYLRLSRLQPPVFGPEVLAEYWHHDGNMSGDKALMLSAALGVLRAEARLAAATGQRVSYRAGLRGWKRHYVEGWWRQLAGAIHERAVTVRLLTRGAAIARLAPLTWLAAPPRRAAELVVRRIRRLAPARRRRP